MASRNKPAARIVYCLFALVLAGLAGCGEPETAAANRTAAQSGDITIKHAWVRPAREGMRISAGYATIVNDGEFADTLTGASADFAGAVELHESREIDGTTTMNPAERLEIPPGEAVRLQSGGYHLMLIDLAGPLVAGETYTVTFSFDYAGDVAVPMIAAGGMTDGDQ